MEESEKRKERLRAIRLEASQADISCSPGTYDVPGGLSNPLAESSTAQVACSAPRFDFYTDPIAAFSANKRSRHKSSEDKFASYSKNDISMVQFPSSPSGPWNPGFVPLAVQNDFAPNLGFPQAGDLCRSPAPPLNPVGMTTTGPVHFASPSAPYLNRATRPLSPMGMTSTYPMHEIASPGAPYLNRATPPRSSMGMAIPYPMHQIASPGAPYPTGGSPSFGSPQGRGHWCTSSARAGSGWGHSHSPNLGRGRGLWSGSSTGPGSGHSGGGGRGYHYDNPVRGLYNKSMLENPWKDLEPVIWRGVNGAGRISELKSQESDQKPASTKMPIVSDSSNASSLKQSLADYLSAAFDEAVEDVNSV